MDFKIAKAGFFDSYIAFKKENGVITIPRVVQQYEIEVFTETNGKTCINGKYHPIQKGYALLAKPGQIRQSELNFRCNYIHLNIFKKAVADMLNALPDYFEITREQNYHDVLFKILNAENYKESNYFYLHSKIYELLHMLSADANRTTHTNLRYDKDALLIAKRYIDCNYTQNLNLNSIAKQANLSPIYFHKLFKAFTNKTPHDYLQDVRLSHAKHLLAFTQKPIEEIATLSGFSSQAYFNAVFKKEFRITPTQYRKDEMHKYE
ncbi:MAG: helix-turn-helix transcriptional regulator [Clostridia bacterium]|nr:helix-turn-helix transcriptional regulator [Clostridia bacterium]